ncbi:MAG: serine dehydratase subunit alpha family protein [Bacteroidales bacterium]|jgi:L-cysteine desulfidase|nr:serine dehydratase subunit alpha family protein [Bacteroidales bacterium]
MLSKSEITKILELLRSEAKAAVGGTEPMAIALAVAKATELLGCCPEKVVAKLSPKIIKNSVGVNVNGMDGAVGIPYAIALGACYGKPEAELDVLNHVTPDMLPAARKFIDERRYVLKQAHTFELIYVEIEATGGGHEAKVIIAKSPTHFMFLKADDKILLDERWDLAKEYNRTHESWLNMKMIYDFAVEVPIDQLQFLLDGARLNKEIAHMAFNGQYGLGLGKMMKGSFEERMVGQNTMPRMISYACAACDVRMSGARIKVFCNSGSGNQGIVGTLPLLIFAEETCVPESKLLRGLAMSMLTIIYIKHLLGNMSAHCSCVLASAGSACGLAYMLGGDYDAVVAAVKNNIASLTGMVCDGAKPSCALRISGAVNGAFQSAMMAIEGICVPSTDGIIEDSVDRSLDNIANIGRDAMLENDSMILRIITEKEGKEADN